MTVVVVQTFSKVSSGNRNAFLVGGICVATVVLSCWLKFGCDFDFHFINNVYRLAIVPVFISFLLFLY